MIPGLRETALALRAGTLSARAYCEGILTRIRERDAHVQAWGALGENRALALAGAWDVLLMKIGGNLSFFLGGLCKAGRFLSARQGAPAKNPGFHRGLRGLEEGDQAGAY